MAPHTLSAHNARVVRLGRLSARRRAREEEGVIVVDGPVLLAEALDAGLAVDEVFVDADRCPDSLLELAERAEAAGARIFPVGSDVLRRATDPVHPQPVAAIATRPKVDSDVLESAASVLVLIGVADPGNGGTLIRAALAAGFDAVAVTTGTVELFGPKALRSSAGAAFRIPVVTLGDELSALSTLTDAGLTTMATTSHDGVAYDQLDLTGRCAVLVGNEAHGLDPAVIDAASLTVRIPMDGPAESLNAAMAGTILCFEVLRQRRSQSADLDPVPPTMESSCPP